MFYLNKAVVECPKTKIQNLRSSLARTEHDLPLEATHKKRQQGSGY